MLGHSEEQASRGGDLISEHDWTSIYDKYSGSVNITTHPDHIGHCKTASG